MARFYKVSEFARMIGVSPYMLRRYEESGILVPHHKSANGYRYYSAEQYKEFIEKKNSKK